MKNIFKILAVLSAVTAAVLVVVKYWDKINAKMQSIKNSCKCDEEPLESPEAAEAAEESVSEDPAAEESKDEAVEALAEEAKDAPAEETKEDSADESAVTESDFAD